MSDSRLMNFVAGIFQRPTFVSEPDKLLSDLVRARPEIAADRKHAREIWWDHPQDLDTVARHRASRVAQQPYVYQTKA